MVTEIDAAPDWLTVTTKNWRDTQYLRAVGMLYIGAERGSTPWRFREYYGRRRHDEHGKGGVAFAEAEAGCHGILQAWGDMSACMGRAISKTNFKATRVDLAVTVLYGTIQRSIAELMPELNAAAHNYSAVIPMNAEGGTLYIGSRASEAFGRMYDKGAQIKGDVPLRRLWRYEVEYKRHLAEQAAEDVWYKRMTVDQMRDYVLGNVERFFRQHGVPTPFTVSDAKKPSLVRYATRIEDNQKTIKWLTEQVQPALVKLIAKGKYAELCNALGIGVLDGVPVFETIEVLPDTQLMMWPELDKS